MGLHWKSKHPREGFDKGLSGSLVSQLSDVRIADFPAASLLRTVRAGDKLIEQVDRQPHLNDGSTGFE
jgi:hypothetical protein